MSLLSLLANGLNALVPHALAFQIEPPGGGGGVGGFTAYVGQVIPVLQGLFVGVAFVMLLITAATMIIFSQSESTMSETKSSYLYIVIGGIVVGVATMIAQAVAPGLNGVGGEVVSRVSITPAFYNVILYLKYALAAGFIANIVIQAFRLISSQGEQEYIDRARKRLIHSLVGVGIVLLADSIVRTVNLESNFMDVQPSNGVADMTIMNMELVGLANFLLTILGTCIVVAIIIAGIMFIVSVNESLKEKALNIIKTCVIILVIILVSYALVNLFLNVSVFGHG